MQSRLSSLFCQAEVKPTSVFGLKAPTEKLKTPGWTSFQPGRFLFLVPNYFQGRDGSPSHSDATRGARPLPLFQMCLRIESGQSNRIGIRWDIVRKINRESVNRAERWIRNGHRGLTAPVIAISAEILNLGVGSS